MAVKVWLSIQSDFGITMGELGSLSSDTDSKLIASTLMALKDIVTLEASSGESHFMTGAVESSSFGTFAIAINEEIKLIMSYVISAESGSTIKEATVNLVQAICTNLGKQLTQFGQIVDHAQSGQSIHRSTLIQAFLNAATVVKFEHNLPNDKRLVGKGMQTIVTDVLNNKESLLQLFDYILGYNWKTDETRWNFGVPLEKELDKLIQGLAYEIVYIMADDRPLSFLYSSDPRNEHKRIYHLLKTEIKHRSKDITSSVIKQFLTLIESKVDAFIAEIPSVSLHASESIIFKEFSKNAFLEVINEDPVMIFSKVDTEVLRDKYAEIIPNLNYDHLGSILFNSMKNKISPNTTDFVKSFFDGFIGGMGDISLSQPAFDLLIAFSQEFIDGKQLKEAITMNKSVNKTHTAQIRKLIKTKDIERLQVESIEEAVILTNAAGSAVVNVLALVIIDQFLFPVDKQGMVVQDFIDYYLTSGPIIKSLTIMVAFLEALAKTGQDPELVIPDFQDVVASAVDLNNLKFEIDDHPVEMKLKQDEYILEINGSDEQLFEWLKKDSQVTLLTKNGSKIELNASKIEAEPVMKLVKDPDVLIQAGSIASKRKLKDIALKEVDLWFANIQTELNKLTSEFGEGTSKGLAEFSQFRPILTKHQFQKVDLGPSVAEMLDVFSDEVQQVWDKQITAEWEKIIGDSKAKGEIHKNVGKKVNKFAQNMGKELIKLRKTEATRFVDLVKEITKSLRENKNIIKLALWPDQDEILAYLYDDKHLLPTKDEVINMLKIMTEGKEGLRIEDFERMILNVSLTLFENPPDSVFEPAYNEVISGKRSNSIKKILNRVKSKRDFETTLKDQGQSFASNIYNGLEQLINRINKMYIRKDGIVTSDSGRVYLHIGRLPLSSFPKLLLIENILSFPDVHLKRETDSWLITYEMFQINNAASKNPTIVTFEDAVRFLQQQRFDERLASVFRAISKVTLMIEANAGARVNETYNTLRKVIYEY